MRRRRRPRARARLRARAARTRERRGELAGTPRYMAPEQARAARSTPAADQYASAFALRGAAGAGAAPLPRWVGRDRARATARPIRAALRDDASCSRAARDPARARRRRALSPVLSPRRGRVRGRQAQGDPARSARRRQLAQIAEPGARAGWSPRGGLGPYGAARRPGSPRARRAWRALGRGAPRGVSGQPSRRDPGAALRERARVPPAGARRARYRRDHADARVAGPVARCDPRGAHVPDAGHCLVEATTDAVGRRAPTAARLSSRSMPTRRGRDTSRSPPIRPRSSSVLPPRGRPRSSAIHRSSPRRDLALGAALEGDPSSAPLMRTAPSRPLPAGRRRHHVRRGVRSRDVRGLEATSLVAAQRRARSVRDDPRPADQRRRRFARLALQQRRHRAARRLYAAGHCREAGGGAEAGIRTMPAAIGLLDAGAHRGSATRARRGSAAARRRTPFGLPVHAAYSAARGDVRRERRRGERAPARAVRHVRPAAFGLP